MASEDDASAGRSSERKQNIGITFIFIPLRFRELFFHWALLLFLQALEKFILRAVNIF